MYNFISGHKFVALALLMTVFVTVQAQDKPAGQKNDTRQEFNVKSLLDANNVSWDIPGPTSSESMPLGNGDIGLNVWVEPSGDLCSFIGKPMPGEQPQQRKKTIG